MLDARVAISFRIFGPLSDWNQRLHFFEQCMTLAPRQFGQLKSRRPKEDDPPDPPTHRI